MALSLSSEPEKAWPRAVGAMMEAESTNFSRGAFIQLITLRSTVRVGLRQIKRVSVPGARSLTQGPRRRRRHYNVRWRPAIA